MGWLRRRFLTGLLILLPTVITGYVLYRFFISVDSILLNPLVQRYPFLDIPGLGFLGVFLIILLTGVFAGNFIGSAIISWTESFVFRIPLISRVYIAIKQMSEVFSDFAAEEDGHRLRLEHVKAGKGGLGMVREVRDLSIGDFIVDEDPYPEMDYASALVLAMKKEKKAFKLYLELADLYEEGDMRQLFLSLAQEEAKHKLRFEIEYDDNFLAEM